MYFKKCTPGSAHLRSRSACHHDIKVSVLYWFTTNWLLSRDRQGAAVKSDPTLDINFLLGSGYIVLGLAGSAIVFEKQGITL